MNNDDNPTKFVETNALLFFMEPDTVERGRALLATMYYTELIALEEAANKLSAACYLARKTKAK